MDIQTDPNTSVQTAQLATNQTMMNQTTADRTEKNKYKIPILSDRNRFDKNKPTNVVGTNYRVDTPYVQPKSSRRNDGSRR